jgi:hypothetical protein
MVRGSEEGSRMIIDRIVCASAEEAGGQEICKKLRTKYCTNTTCPTPTLGFYRSGLLF